MRMFQRHRITAPLAAAAIIWTGCEPTGSCEGDYCGVAVIVSGADANVLLPIFTQTTVETAVTDLMFLKLAEIGLELNTVGDSGFEGRLARSWTYVDPLTIAFSMDPNARWADGTPVTAHDVAFTFELYRDTLINSPAASLLEPIESVTAMGDSVAMIRFGRTYPEQFFDATQHMRILPRHLLDSIPRTELRTHQFTRDPVGNGPYRLSRWEPGEFLELRADTAFFLGRPGLRRIIWRITPDYQSAITQVLADEADILEAVVGIENVARVRDAAQLRLVPYASPLYGYLAFNFRDPENPERPHPLFRERNLRRALSMSLDRETIARAVFGEYGEVPVGPTTKMQWIWSDSLPQLDFDTARARSLLAGLGWRDVDGDGILDRDGVPLSFDLLLPSSSQVRRQAAVIIQDQFRRLGVEMNIVELEPNLWVTRSSAGEFDATFGFWAGDPSPTSIQRVWTSSGIGDANYGHYRNARFDDLVDRALKAGNLEDAADLWFQALSHINSDAPAIWLMSPVLVAAVHRRFENVTIRSDQWAANLWRWYVPEDMLTDRDRVGEQ